MKKKSDYMKATKKILYNYSYLVAELNIKQQELGYIRTNSGMTGISYSLTPPSQTNAINSKVEDVGDKNVEDEKRLLGEIRRLQMNMDKIENVLEILGETEKAIIELRYTDNQTWGYVADTLGYSVIHCKRLGNNATMKICSLLFGFKSFVDLPLFEYMGEKS